MKHPTFMADFNGSSTVNVTDGLKRSLDATKRIRCRDFTYVKMAHITASASFKTFTDAFLEILSWMENQSRKAVSDGLKWLSVSWHWICSKFAQIGSWIRNLPHAIWSGLCSCFSVLTSAVITLLKYIAYLIFGILFTAALLVAIYGLARYLVEHLREKQRQREAQERRRAYEEWIREQQRLQEERAEEERHKRRIQEEEERNKRRIQEEQERARQHWQRIEDEKRHRAQRQYEEQLQAARRKEISEQTKKLQDWKYRVEQAKANKGKDAVAFPEPPDPFKRCHQCALSGTQQFCSHGVEQYLLILGREGARDYVKEMVPLVHPDRYGGCRDKYKECVQLRANEISQILLAIRETLV